MLLKIKANIIRGKEVDEGRGCLHPLYIQSSVLKPYLAPSYSAYSMKMLHHEVLHIYVPGPQLISLLHEVLHLEVLHIYVPGPQLLGLLHEVLHNEVLYLYAPVPLADDPSP